MNIFHKVALEGLKKSRTRTLVTIIGAILSAAMLTGVTTFGISLINYMVNGKAAETGDWQVAFFNVPSAFVQEQKEEKGVSRTVTAENIGYAMIEDGQNLKKPYLFIAGYSEEAMQALPINLMSGRLPENSNEIVVSEGAIVSGGMKVSAGDTLSLTVGSRMKDNRESGWHETYDPEQETFVKQEEKTYTVVGTCQRPSFEDQSDPGYTCITKAEAQNSAASYMLFVTLKNPRVIHQYVKRTGENQEYTLNNDVLRFMGLSDSPGDRIFTSLLLSVGGIVIFIIMLGSIFLIRNTFYISLNERTHQFGILLSVGATEKQLRNSVLFEGLCISAVSIPIGVIIGLGGIEIVIRVVTKNFAGILYDTVPLTLTLSLPAIIAAAAVSMITILISAYIPARKAAAVPVMECIRQTNEIKVEAKTVKTSKFAWKIYGLEGMLALKNFKRNKKRYRSIILSLVLSIVLFISTNAFILYLKMASEMAVVFTDIDIALDAHEMEEDEMLALYEKLKTVKGVYESSYQELVTYSCTVNESELSPEFQEIMGLSMPEGTEELSIDIQFLSESSYEKLLSKTGLPKEEYTGQNAKLIAQAKINMDTNRVREVSEYVDMFTSSSMNVQIVPKAEGREKSGHEKNVVLTFVETVFPDSLPSLEQTEQEAPYHFVAAAPYSLRESLEASSVHVKSKGKGLVFRSKTPAQSVKAMQEIISGEHITGNYRLYNLAKMLDTNNNMIFFANVFAYTFVIMISLIAVANVFNTISTNIKMRRRELAMLRSVGMAEGDFQKMMNFECVFYGMKALLVGVPTAILFSWLIYKGMYAGGAEEIEFVLPWNSIGISVFSVFFIVFITMLYAVSKIKKENIIDALRDDMI